MMISRAETLSAAFVRDPTAGKSVGDIVVDSLELQVLAPFVDQMLRAVHDEWNSESIDGVYAGKTQKTAYNTLEFRGACILISDQKIVPLVLKLQTFRDTDEICWTECRLGEARPNGMIRTPCKDGWVVACHEILRSDDHGDWYFSVSFGEREL